MLMAETEELQPTVLGLIVKSSDHSMSEAAVDGVAISTALLQSRLCCTQLCHPAQALHMQNRLQAARAQWWHTGDL